jgi:hypothetical protein
MRFPVTWRPRPSPLEPAGVAARGTAARALAGRLLARGDEELSRLAGVAGPELLIALGAPGDLPWVDGVSYLGQDPDAPLLLLPTALEPSVHPRLLQDALLARGSKLPPPLAVLLSPDLLVSTAAARPVSRPVLEGWLSRREG